MYDSETRLTNRLTHTEMLRSEEHVCHIQTDIGYISKNKTFFSPFRCIYRSETQANW